MYILGELDPLSYFSGALLLLSVLVILIGLILIGSTLEIHANSGERKPEPGVVVGVIVGVFLLFTGGTMTFLDGPKNKAFYQENGHQFLVDAGIQVVETEKYQESEKLSSNLKIVQRQFKYKGQKVKKIHIDHWVENSPKDKPDIKVELDNNSTFVVKDGEELLEKGDAQVEDLYFLIELKPEEIYALSKEKNEWIINSKNVRLIRSEKELESTLNKLNE